MFEPVNPSLIEAYRISNPDICPEAFVLGTLTEQGEALVATVNSQLEWKVLGLS